MKLKYKYSEMLEIGHIMDGNTTISVMAKEYGEHIVNCVNTHAELVKCLEDLNNAIDRYWNREGFMEPDSLKIDICNQQKKCFLLLRTLTDTTHKLNKQ